MVTQFAVLDMRINKFLGSFGRQTVSYNPETTCGQISPDGGWCLIKIPCARNRRMSVLKLYDLRCCELFAELLLSPVPRPMTTTAHTQPVRAPLAPLNDGNQVLPPYNNTNLGRLFLSLDPPTIETRHLIVTNRSAPILFAFDPRFMRSRLAITNLNFLNPRSTDSMISQKTSLSLIKLPTWERLITTTAFKGIPPTSSSRSHMGAGPTRPVATNTSHPSHVSATLGSNSPTSRGFSRRRPASDLPQPVDPLGPNSPYGTPYLLNLFFSRDGYLLFVVSTEQRICRCAHIGHGIASSTYSMCDLSDPAFRSGGTSGSTAQGSVQPQPNRFTPVHSHFLSVNATNLTTRSTGGSRLQMPPPTLPGCTTLWLTIFDSDTLNRLRTLRFDLPVCPVHTCPTNYIPVMSRCGSRLALLTNQYCRYVSGNGHRASAPPVVVEVVPSSFAVLAAASSSASLIPNHGERAMGTGSVGTPNLRHSVPCVNADMHSRSASRLDSNRITTTDTTSATASSGGGSTDALVPGQSCLNLREGKMPGPSGESYISNTQFASSSPNLPPTALLDSPNSTATSPTSRVHFSTNTTSSNPTLTHPTSSTTTPPRPTRENPLSHRHRNTSPDTLNSPIPVFTAPTASAALMGLSSGQLRQCELLLVYQLPPPPSLQALIRQKILQRVQDDALDRLNLPTPLISYLRFQPSFTGAGSCISRSDSFTPTLRSDSFDMSVLPDVS